MTAAHFSAAEADEVDPLAASFATPRKQTIPRMRPRTLIIAFSICVGVVQLAFLALRFKVSGVEYYRLVRTQQLSNFEFIMCIVSYFLWRRLTHASAKICFPKCILENGSHAVIPFGNRWRQICLADICKSLITLFLLLSHVSFFFYYAWLGQEPNVLALLSLTAVGTYLHVFIFILISELFHHISRFYRNSRFYREFCCGPVVSWLAANRDTMTLFAAVSALIVALGGVLTTVADPVITHVSIPLNNMPPGAAHPLRIALLSDIHIGPTVGKRRIERIASLTNELNPDVIAISGDLADGFLTNLKEAAGPLCSLKANYGVYFATGNHEYMHGNVEEWFGFLRGCGITVLHNENHRVETGQDNVTLCIAGTDDLYAAKAHIAGHGMDAQKALQGCQPSDVRVLLAHQPNAAAAVIKSKQSKDVDLILSGHTHAGQFYMFAPIVYAVNAFTHGLYYDRSTDTHVMVSAGVNFFGPPIKMFGTCEIIDITLTPRISRPDRTNGRV